MPAVHSPQTIAEALHTATSTLALASSSPRLDAELLLEHVTGRTRTSFRTTPERELPAPAGWAFQQLVTRRLKGEPIAYIRGQQEFWSLTFEVTPAVLIPRPETELVVERALAALTTAQPRVADLGTGSGAIALALAHERGNAQVVATDLSQDALEVARRNIARFAFTNVTLRRGNWLAALGTERFHCIAANPPYIAAGDPDLAPDVRRHEPASALIAGRTGLEALEQIAKGARKNLEPGGVLILEHGWKQQHEVRRLLVRHGYAHVTSHADLAGRPRVTEARSD